MRPRGWLVAGIALVVLGIGAAVFAYPLSPHPEVKPTGITFVGSPAEQGLITVTGPGVYAIWQAGKEAPDRGRCRITDPDGKEVPVDKARNLTRWETDGDAVDIYTELGTFVAAGPGPYGIDCGVDPDSPGDSFVVTDEPDTRLSVAAGVFAVVALAAGVALVVLAFVRRRRSAVHQVQ